MNRTVLAVRIGAALPLAFAALAANATPVPPSVAAMIDAAGSDPATLKTVSDLAKKTNPDSAAEIDAQVAKITAANEAARVDKLEHQSFTEGWSGEGSLGAFVSSGNTSSSGVALGLTLKKESIRWRNTFGAGINYQKQDGVTTQERYFVGNKLDYKFSDRFYVYGLVGWERDTFAGYDSRFSESLGLGYKLIATP
jgi:putative salt-induced outer membrane protein